MLRIKTDTGEATSEPYAQDGVTVGTAENAKMLENHPGSYYLNRANHTGTDTGGGSLTDGDKGDITVSGSGATWTIDLDANRRFVTDTEKAAWNAKQAALGFTPENAANKNTANGYAGLDSSGLINSTQLPSFVDDVLEYANLAAFPATGTTGKIYVALDTNKTYRWSGSAYIVISDAPGSTDAVTEGTINLYFTPARALAAAPAETTTTTGSLINSATAKTTPVDTDYIGLMDSAAANILKKLSWLNIKATLKTYFDTLYFSITGNALTPSGGTFALTGNQTVSGTLNNKLSTAYPQNVTALAITAAESGKDFLLYQSSVVLPTPAAGLHFHFAIQNGTASQISFGASGIVLVDGTAVTTVASTANKYSGTGGRIHFVCHSANIWTVERDSTITYS